MKKFISIVLTISIIFALASCANTARPDWQEHLDLGQKYLLDGNYEQAIVEFNKVIEIEPKNVDAYIGLAEAYAAQGDYDSAISVLEQGYAETGNQSLQDKINELRGLTDTQTEQSETVDSEVTNVPETVADLPVEPVREKTFFSVNVYERYTYDEYGRCVAWLTGTLALPSYQLIFSYDESGKVEKATYYSLSYVGSDSVNLLSYSNQNKVEAEHLYYNDVGNLMMDFKTDESSAKFEFSNQMYVMSFNLSYPNAHSSISYERDESGRVTSGTIDSESADTVISSSFEMIYDESGLPECSTIQYGTGTSSVNYVFSFEEGLLKSVTCNLKEPSYPESAGDMSDEGFWNAVYDDNKRLVKVNMKSYAYAVLNGSIVTTTYPLESETEYEYDSDGKLSRIEYTTSFTNTDYINNTVYEYEHTPYLSLKNVILPDNSTYYLDTQNGGLVKIYYAVNNGHGYVANATIDKEFFIPADLEKDFKGLYIDGVQLTELVDYIISDEIIMLYASAFTKIDVLSENMHTIATEFRNESGELLSRKAINIHLDLERLQ